MNIWSPELCRLTGRLGSLRNILEEDSLTLGMWNISCTLSNTFSATSGSAFRNLGSGYSPSKVFVRAPS